jgi:endonuclease-3
VASMSDGTISASTATLHVEARLAGIYGRPLWRSHAPPLDELIATILSQHTSDLNSGRAFEALRTQFPTWPDVLTANETDIAAAIQPGGLARIKASRIKRVLCVVDTESGALTLDWIRDWPLEEARAWLTALPGVGPKTAACVLLFSLGLPAMPVDTHVHRVGRRLGLIPADVSAEEAHTIFDHLLGPDRDAIYSLHLNLIRHGRTTCKARNPECDRCVLSDLCPSAFRAGGRSTG